MFGYFVKIDSQILFAVIPCEAYLGQRRLFCQRVLLQLEEASSWHWLSDLQPSSCDGPDGCG